MSVTIDLRLGDCVEIMRGLPDGCVDAVVTDPPYGSGGRDGSVHLNDQSIIGNKMSRDAHIWVTRSWARELHRVTLQDAHTYVFTDWRKHVDVKIAFETTGWECRSVIIWAKGNGMGEYWRHSFECILFLTKRLPRKLTHGGCFNVLNADQFAPVRGSKLHPSEKPVPLMSYLADASTYAGQTVLDPFMGSGTTGVACVQTGRNFIGIEIDPGYFAIAERRIAEAQRNFQPQLMEVAQ